MDNNITFLELCLTTDTNPELWKEWIEDTQKDKNIPENELIGISSDDFDDLKNKKKSIYFYLLKYQQNKNYARLWPGCYIKYIYEEDLINTHFQYGWIDVIDVKQGKCKLQCDDNFFGQRAKVIKLDDIIEILPYKERPLLFYKTMMCGECNACDRLSNNLPPNECQYFDFFNAIVNKQKCDQEFIKLYYQVMNTHYNEKCNCNHQEAKCTCTDCHNCKHD